MTRILTLAYLWFMSGAYAFAQNAADQPPTTYTEPGGMTAMIIFFTLFFGGIGVFVFWIWYQNKKQQQQQQQK